MSAGSASFWHATGTRRAFRIAVRCCTSNVGSGDGWKPALGRTHAGQTVTVLVSDTTLTIELGDGETRVIRRTTPAGA